MRHKNGDPDLVHDADDPAECRCNAKPKGPGKVIRFPKR